MNTVDRVQMGGCEWSWLQSWVGALLLSPPPLSPHQQAAGARLPLALCGSALIPGERLPCRQRERVRCPCCVGAQKDPVWGGPLWEARATAPAPGQP